MSVSQPRQLIKLCALVLMPTQVLAHASDQGLVLLLPTDLYISSGVAAVALTVLMIAVLPDRAAAAVFRPLRLLRLRFRHLPVVTSCLSAGLFVWLLAIGLTGARDPLSNPLPLMIWTVWWVGLVTVQGLAFDIWRWINPWRGPLAVLRVGLGLRPVFRMPTFLGYTPAAIGFLAFAGFLMADIAPSDPARLAKFAGLYWVLMLAGGILFGPRWLLRGEALSILARAYASVAPIGRYRGRMTVGLWGWKILHRAAPPLGLAVFIVMILASGSFDGLNETFWWLAQLGVNPLEFPGRSAVVWQNAFGLLLANVLLVAVFATATWLGLKLAQSDMSLRYGFALFAPALLPIALGYHIAHYLTSFLVDSQYAFAALNDPLTSGADLLGLGTFYVTTGFFNTPDTVRLIFLTQAGAVVLGHVVAVLLAHALAVSAFGSNRQAVLSQVPLAAFMIAYTFFGLWLLASPRGV